jgi:hypothetical protein
MSQRHYQKGVPERLTNLDNVLDLIAAQIRQIIADNNNRVPPALESSGLAPNTARPICNKCRE